MTRLYVANVSLKADTSELKELLSDCGKIKLVDIKDGSGYIVNKFSLNQQRNSKHQTRQRKQ